MYHKHTPGVEAEAGGIAEAKAEVGAIAKVMARVTVKVALEAALGVDDQGPLVGPHPERG